MKKFVVFLILLSTACSNEHIVNPIQPRDGGDGTLTFTLPGLKNGAISYAIAEGEENLLSDLTIYMFNDATPKVLERIYRPDNIVLGGSEANRTATIDVTGKLGQKIFYFVGNGRGRSDDLVDLTAGITLETSFIEAITNQSTDTLSTPLLMSGKTVITDVSSPGTNQTELEVKLARRVARLDIDNNPDSTNFDVKTVLVSKARLRGYVFGEATEIPAKDKGEGTYKPIALNKDNKPTPNRSDSVFYLYPTTLGAGKTEISLEGEFNGETKVYNFELSSDVELSANRRYVLKVKKVDVIKAEMELVISDWEDEAIDPLGPETDLVTFSSIDYTTLTGIVLAGEDTYDLTGVTTAGKLTFTTSSFDGRGTTATVKYNHGNENTYSGLRINHPQPTLTYSAFYEQTYEIDIPVIADTQKPLEMVITLRNEANTGQKKVITLYVNRYMDTKLYPVRVGDLYWAPVNAGVSGPNARLTDPGLLYQWGRGYIGFTYEAGINRIDTVLGPMSASEAETGRGKGKFIKTAGNPNDWQIPSVTSWATGFPCPEGWRVPTQAEWTKIETLHNGGYDKNDGKVTWDDANKRVVISGDNETDTLYLPANGYLNYTRGASFKQGEDGGYWSSEAAGTKAGYLTFYPANLYVYTSYRSYGRSVRCVKE